MEIKEKIEKVLEELRPALMAHGGNVELVEVTDDGVVRVKLVGACGGCPMSTYTLRLGIEKELKKAVPEIKSVEQI